MSSGSQLAPLKLPSWVDTLDDLADRAWEPLRGHASLDRLFYGASAVGDFSMIWHAINGLRTWHRGEIRADAVRAAVVLAVESILVNQGIKRLFERPRPHQEGRPHHLRQPSTSSFPSGHASAAAVAATVLGAPPFGGAGVKGGVARLALRSAAGVVATSRLHVRIHHASDVAAGTLVGIGIGRVARRLWPLTG